MNLYKRLLAASIALILIAMLFSCSDYAKRDGSAYNTGRVISVDEITKIVSELKPENKEPYYIDESTVFYWTENGSKLHLFNDCQSLSRTDPENILSGNIGAVSSKLSSKPCSFCLKKASLSEEDFLNIFS